MREREEFLAGKEKELEVRNQLFADFEKAWLKAGECYRAAMGARAKYLKGWREDLCRLPSEHDLRSQFVTEKVMADLRDFNDADHIGVRSKGLAKEVAAGAAAHLERLRASSLPRDEQDIEENAA